MTGKFDDEGLVDDVEGLSNKEIFDLQEWISFYEKDYKYVGKVLFRITTSQATRSIVIRSSNQ